MTDSAGNSGAQLLELRVDAIEPWPGLNPRRRFEEEALAELTESVKEKGVLEPLLVHTSMNMTDSTVGWIVAGERRWRAAKAAEIETVPCIVREFSRAEALEVAIVENLQRADITAIEEARGFADWLGTTKGTQKDLAQKIGRTQPYVSNRVRILALPDGILELLEDGVLDYTAARDELVPYTKVQPEAAREKFFKALEKELRGNWHGYLGQSIRRAIEKVARPNWTYAFHHRQMGMDAIHVDREDHEGCGCHSPVAWACFDVEAWEQRNEEAKARKAEADQEEEERDDDRLEAARDRLAKLPIVSEETLDQELDGEWQEVTRGTELELLLDPRDLPRERLVWARLSEREFVDREWVEVEYFSLVCLDLNLADAAVKGGEEELADRLTARERQRVQEEREEAARGSVTAEVLRSVFLADRDHLFPVLKDLSMLAEPLRHWWDWNNAAAAADLERLSKVQLEVVAKILHIRRVGGYHERDPLPGEVRAELEAEYQAALEQILPPLPEGVDLDLDADVSTLEDAPGDVDPEDEPEEPLEEPEDTPPVDAGTTDGGRGAAEESPPEGNGGEAPEESDAPEEEVPGDEEPEDGPWELQENEELIGDGPFAIRTGGLRTIVFDTRNGETAGGRIRERDARRVAEQKNSEAAAEAVPA